MRAAATRWRATGALLCTGAVLAAPTMPARAEFYDLQGRYECLADPDKICYDATPSPADPPAADAAGVGSPPVAGTPEAKDGAKPVAPAGTKPGGKRKPPSDPLQEIGARLQARKPDDGDIITLVALARGGDARAFEMLAWCSLTGTGVPRDPVRAYFLYGRAAAAGAPGSRENQSEVFKRAMSQDQRQQVLEIENGRAPAP